MKTSDLNWLVANSLVGEVNACDRDDVERIKGAGLELCELELGLRILEAPQWLHDCDRDVFLGRYEDRDGEYDLYYADHGGLPDTVIARFNSSPDGYASGIQIRHADPRLAVAYDRAMRLRLVQEGEKMTRKCANSTIKVHSDKIRPQPTGEGYLYG